MKSRERHDPDAELRALMERSFTPGGPTIRDLTDKIGRGKLMERRSLTRQVLDGFGRPLSIGSSYLPSRHRGRKSRRSQNSKTAPSRRSMLLSLEEKL